MIPETNSSTTITSSTLLHCQYRSASGHRFCRQPISDSDSGLCSRHAALLQKDLDHADLAASLIGDIQEFRSAADINHSLGELYKLQARNKITPRRAAVMAYTANLLLRTLPAIAHETNAVGDGPQRIIIDMPSPDYDEPRPENPTYQESPLMTSPLSQSGSCLISRRGGACPAPPTLLPPNQRLTGGGLTGVPEPSLRVWMESTGKFSKRSTKPLGHRTCTPSILLADPSPK
jgi:hypothetical protein